MNWPRPPLGDSALARFCKMLLNAAAASEVKPGPGYTVERTAQGTFIKNNFASLPQFEAKICNDETNEMETFVIFGYKKPEPPP